MELLDHLESEARKNAFELLKWIGAVDFGAENALPKICTFNLARILIEVRQLLPYIERIASANDAEFPILEFAARSIDDLETEIARLSADASLRAAVLPELGGRKLMQGWMGSSPLYSLLPYLPEGERRIEQCRWYKAALLLISALLKDYSAKVARDYSSAIGSAANALRLCTDKPLLDDLPELSSLDIKEAHANLETLRNADGYAATSAEAGYIRALETLFRFFLRKIGGHVRAGEKEEVDSVPDSSEKQSGKRIRIARPIDASRQAIREAKKSGLAPSELGGNIEYITEDDEYSDEDPPSSPPPQTLARQAMARQHRLDAIERQAQLLPISRNRLVPWEYAIFLRLLKDSLAVGVEQKSALRAEAVAALAISFWLSRKLGDTLRVHIYRDLTQLPAHIHPGFIGFVQNPGEWVISALRPKGEPKHLDVDRSAAIQVANALHLPDIVGLSTYLSRLRSWERAGRNGSASAFESPGSVIEDKCGEILNEAKVLSHDRVTQSRIADTLFLTVFDCCGDKATASLTLGRPHRLGDTQLHYTEVTSDKLRQIYAQACRKIAERAVAELREFDRNPARPAKLDESPARGCQNFCV